MKSDSRHRIVLYSTEACHLCELASAMLEKVVRDIPDASYTIVDISDSDGLFDRYGWLIPVVRFADGSELNWPFDESDVRSRVTAS
ncbi:MAG: glutaredoxin family protein [Chromatocurvus sp.]